MGKGVRSSEQFARDMDHLEIKVSEVNQPPHLAAVEHLGLAEIREVLVISEDLNWKGGAMEVVSPRLQGMDDSEEFAVVDVIISFCRGERLGEVGAWVPVPIGIGLEKDGTRCVFRSIGSNGKGGGKIRKMEDRFGQE